MYHINHRILPSKHFGSPKTEPGAGVIDAFYPIILTIIITELLGNSSKILDKSTAKLMVEQRESSPDSSSYSPNQPFFFSSIRLYYTHRVIAGAHCLREGRISLMGSVWPWFHDFYLLSIS